MDKGVKLSELGAMIKGAFAETFPDRLWVVAEIAELKENRAGHCYLELVEKDSGSEQIVARNRATIWAFTYRMLKPYFETTTGGTFSSGIKVLLNVGIEYHEVYGLTLNIRDIDPAYTLGDIAQKRQQVLIQLEEEGVLDMNKEVDLPDIPNKIAIISSPTAAGYEDFVNQLENNPYGFKFVCKLFPALMQGDKAVGSIIAALERVYLNEALFDAVVIIRGGGAQLDLYCFDDYELALHVAQFPLPVLTGIGHEKDDTVADRVAHTRLKTPTAVAEFLIDRLAGCVQETDYLQQQFVQLVEELLRREQERLVNSTLQLKPQVMQLLKQQHYKLDLLVKSTGAGTTAFVEHRKMQLHRCLIAIKHAGSLVFSEHKSKNRLHARELHFYLDNYLQKQQRRLGFLEKTNNLLDPVNVLKRGYSLTLSEGKLVKSIHDVNTGDLLTTRLIDGEVISRTEEKT